MNIYLLDGKDMSNRYTLFQVIGNTLKFPEWFGYNLDALADCISEMKSEETAIVFVNTDALINQLGSYGNKVLCCFRILSEEYGFFWIEKE